MDGQIREKRLVLRVLERWRSLCEGDALPRRAQIDPRLFGKDWTHCVLIDIDPKLERSRFAFVGDALRDPNWPALERQSLAECQENTLLHAATSYAARVIAKGVPISTGGVGMHEGAPVVYRSILMPLSEGSGRIDGLLGAVNCREIPVEEDVHPLQQHGAPASLVGAERI